VGGGDGQRAGVLLALNCVADALEVATSRMMISMLEHLLAGLGDTLEPLAVAGKDVDAQFFFQLEDGLGYAGCEVCSALAVSVRFRLRRTASCTKAELVQVHGIDQTGEPLPSARAPVLQIADES
jgi:hypothetical protein